MSGVRKHGRQFGSTSAAAASTGIGWGISSHERNAHIYPGAVPGKAVANGKMPIGPIQTWRSGSPFSQLDIVCGSAVGQTPYRQRTSFAIIKMVGAPASKPSPKASAYRGSQKHKNRPTSERKGTLCPEWSHVTSREGYRSDPFKHDWADTEAHRLFEASVGLAGAERRYATANGIAFEAKPTNDGTWHGYPIPWEAVPHEIVEKWVDSKKVTRREIRKYWSKDLGDLKWAIGENIE